MAIDTRTIGQLPPRTLLLSTDLFEIQGDDGVSYNVTTQDIGNFIGDIIVIPLSNVVIDVSKDWGAFGITNLGDVSINATNKLFFDAGNNTYIHEQSADHLEIVVGAQIGLTVNEVSSEVDVVSGKLAALALNATRGFFYIPSGAGVPTGTPAGYTGKVAMFYDTVNDDFYIYNGAWRSVSLI